MDWKDQLTSYTVTVNGGSSTSYNFIYDSIGNPTNDGTWEYTREQGRQLQSMTNGATTATFMYNHDGIRVKKVVNGVTTNIYVHGSQVVHQSGSNGHYFHFFYDAQGKLAEIRYNGAAYGVIQNLQGDIIGLIDNTGTEVVRYVYDSWGKVLSVTGSMASTLGAWNPIRYRGYYYDVETGMYYLGSRYYHPQIGRFSNSDTIINSNIFSYCQNSPIILIDKHGTEASDARYPQYVDIDPGYSTPLYKFPSCTGQHSGYVSRGTRVSVTNIGDNNGIQYIQAENGDTGYARYLQTSNQKPITCTDLFGVEDYYYGMTSPYIYNIQLALKRIGLYDIEKKQLSDRYGGLTSQALQELKKSYPLMNKKLVIDYEVKEYIFIEYYAALRNNRSIEDDGFSFIDVQ